MSFVWLRAGLIWQRSAKRFGLLDFEGELPRGKRVASHSVGSDREALLRAAMQRPELVVPGIANLVALVMRRWC